MALFLRQKIQPRTCVISCSSHCHPSLTNKNLSLRTNRTFLQPAWQALIVLRYCKGDVTPAIPQRPKESQQLTCFVRDYGGRGEWLTIPGAANDSQLVVGLRCSKTWDPENLECLLPTDQACPSWPARLTCHLWFWSFRLEVLAFDTE